MCLRRRPRHAEDGVRGRARRSPIERMLASEPRSRGRSQWWLRLSDSPASTTGGRRPQHSRHPRHQDLLIATSFGDAWDGHRDALDFRASRARYPHRPVRRSRGGPRPEDPRIDFSRRCTAPGHPTLAYGPHSPLPLRPVTPYPKLSSTVGNTDRVRVASSTQLKSLDVGCDVRHLSIAWPCWQLDLHKTSIARS